MRRLVIYSSGNELQSFDPTQLFLVELLFLPSWNQNPYLSKHLLKGIQFVKLNGDGKKLR